MGSEMCIRDSSLLRARVVDVVRAGDRLRVHLAGEAGPEVADADLVVNCLGAGTLGRTESALLRSVLARGTFGADISRRGFRMVPGTRRIEGHDDAYVIGPLLNREAGETHVESIRAVYSVAEELATVLHARLARGREGAVDDKPIPAGASGSRRR